MNCVRCGHPEISKNSSGTFYEPGMDTKTIKRICGNCIQILFGKKEVDMWGDKKINHSTLRRKRRK